MPLGDEVWEICALFGFEQQVIMIIQNHPGFNFDPEFKSKRFQVVSHKVFITFGSQQAIMLIYRACDDVPGVVQVYVRRMVK
jgi:hypothetical protein